MVNDVLMGIIGAFYTIPLLLAPTVLLSKLVREMFRSSSRFNDCLHWLCRNDLPTISGRDD